MDSRDEKSYQDKFASGKINEYELARLLGLKDTEIGAYILINGLKQIDKNALYAIACPACESKWLIPYVDVYKCDNCGINIMMEYN